MGKVLITPAIASVGMKVGRNPDNWPYGGQDLTNQGDQMWGEITDVGSNTVRVRWENGTQNIFSTNYQAGGSTLILWRGVEPELQKLPGTYLTSTTKVEPGSYLVLGKHLYDSEKSGIAIGERVKIVQDCDVVGVLTEKKPHFYVRKECFLVPAKEPPSDIHIKEGDVVRFSHPEYSPDSKNFLTVGKTYPVMKVAYGGKYVIVKSNNGNWVAFPREIFSLVTTESLREDLKSLDTQQRYDAKTISTPIKTRKDEHRVSKHSGECGFAFKVRRSAPKIQRGKGQGQTPVCSGRAKA